MSFLATAAIIAIAGPGLIVQDQAQTLAQRFLSVRSDLEKHLASAQYKEAIGLLNGIIPSEVPEVKNDSQDPTGLLHNLNELGTLQDMHSYMGRALVMSGNIEQSIDSFHKAKGIAELKTKATESFVASRVQAWTQAIEDAKNRLADIETQMKTKEELEAKKRMSSAEKKQLEALKKNALNLENEAAVYKENISKGPAAIVQISNVLEKEKEDSARFDPIISGLEESVKSESEMIASNFGGDKAKYVAAVIDTKENLESQATKDDKITFLNRLLFLDPNNKTVQQQIALLIGN